ncbi:MAG: glycosyltransferase family 2 protein [Syntrophobacteraceae bacterium]
MNSSGPPADHISVCICTYRRNELLDRLLRSLVLQRTKGLFDYSIVVVDNDAAGHAFQTVARIKDDFFIDIRYSIEPERTIPAARNHALLLARGNYIAIIDDDEFPNPDWLLRMYEGIVKFVVDGALGPIHPFFDVKAPAWLVKSGICELPVYRTGTLLHWNQTRTGNVLVKKAVFDRHGLMFDPQFRTGGSDQEFFRQAMARGCQFIAIEEAPVFEAVPPARWTPKYWIKRALVNGFNNRRYDTVGRGRAQQVGLTFKSFGAAAIYALTLPACACLGHHLLIICLEKGCYHLSRACAAFGIELWKKRDF